MERKTRLLLTKKVWAQSANKIHEATLQLMKKQGLEHFRSLTTNNASEFSTHTYAAWGKGTNERYNGLLREFIPKGKSLRNLTVQ